MSEPADRPDPTPPRRGLTAALSAFMEEKNILWGELVGGLLVVGCSVALVVTLWHTLNENPLFKFATFTGAVAAVFEAGLYTLRRWRLESTSRGLLLIALCLTPLAALALLGDGGRIALLTQMVALVLLTFLSWRAARVLTPEGPWLLATAIGLTAACQWPIALLMPEATPRAGLLLGLLPAVCLVLTTGAFLGLMTRAGPLDAPRAGSLFIFLGVGFFSLLVTFGLLILLHGDPAGALGLLAIPVAVAGLAPLLAGSFIHRELGSAPRESGGAGARLGGTTVALAGLVLMFLAVGLAWPRPEAVLTVCLLDFLAFTLVAFRFGLPVAHAIALPCLSGAALMGYFLANGLHQVPEEQVPARMLELMYASPASLVLLSLFGLFGAASELLARWQKGEHALFYALGAAGVGLLSLALITPHGSQPGTALLVYGFTGLGALFLNLRWQRPEVTHAGLALLVGASLWGLWWLQGTVAPPWSAALALEALTLGTLACWMRRPVGIAEPEYLPSAAVLARFSSLLAIAAAGLAGLLVYVSFEERRSLWDPWHVLTGLCLTTLASLRAVVERRPLLGRLGAWLVPLTLVPVVEWLGQWLPLDAFVLLAIVLGVAAVLLAGAAVWASGRSSWGGILAPAWAETAAGTGLVALLLVLLAPEEGWHAVTLASAGATAFLLAWMYRQPALTWVGSTLALAALAHGLMLGLAHWGVPHPLLVALLVHSSLVLGVSVLLRLCVSEESDVGRVFIDPLGGSALVSSLLAIPVIGHGWGDQPGPLALWTLWVSGLWLALACLHRRAELFAGFQVGLAFSVVLGGLAWQPADLLLPRALQLHGLGLAAVVVGWVIFRAWVRPAEGSVAEQLLQPPWPAVDRLLLGGLVVAQLGVAILGIIPGLVEELIPRRLALPWDLPGRDWVQSATGLPAWSLLALLVGALAVELRVRVRGLVLLGLLVLALTVPVLAAGPFAGQRAVASALRWGAGLCLLLSSLPIWLRHRLPLLAERLGLSGEPGPLVAELARRLLVVGTVVPVIGLTLVPVGLSYARLRSPGVYLDSVFVTMGPLLASVGPLFMVCLGLIVHALRERLPGYAFLVGLGGNVMVSLIVRGQNRGVLLADWYVLLVQINAVAFAVTALLWLTARRRLYGEGGTGTLLVVQVGLGVLANIFLLAGGLVPLFLSPGDLPWSVALVGGGWGWVALALTAGACAWYAAAMGKHLLVHVGAATALASAVLLACLAALWEEPWLAYRVLTLAWPLAGAGLLALGWRASAGSPSPPSPLSHGGGERGSQKVSCSPLAPCGRGGLGG